MPNIDLENLEKNELKSLLTMLNNAHTKLQKIRMTTSGLGAIESLLNATIGLTKEKVDGR